MYNEKMLSALKNADNFLLCAHIFPDGDAIGSLLAAGRLLRRMGKKCTMVSPDGVPDKFRCLPDSELVVKTADIAGLHFDAALALDIADEKRMGDVWPVFSEIQETFLIDHHPTNPGYAAHCLIDGEAAATGELICALWEAMGEKLDREAAMQLYCAINLDTGNFSFSSVRAYTFACMEKLMDAGLDISASARQLFMTKSRAHVAALGKALSSMQYFADGQAACMALSKADKETCNASDPDLGGIVNYALYQDGVKMCFMADECDKGWKVSLRALPGYDVAAIAVPLGGGGHKLAAGVTIAGDYAVIEAQLKKAVEAALKA